MVDCAITGTGSGVAARWPEVTTHISNLPISWALAGYMVNVALVEPAGPGGARLPGRHLPGDVGQALGAGRRGDAGRHRLRDRQGGGVPHPHPRRAADDGGERHRCRPGAAAGDPGEDRAAGLRAPLRRALRRGLQRGGRAARRGARSAGERGGRRPRRPRLRLAERLRRGVAALAAGMAYLAGWNYIACALFITADIVGRNLFGVSSAATVEVTGYMLAGGIAWALGAHPGAGRAYPRRCLGEPPAAAAPRRAAPVRAAAARRLRRVLRLGGVVAGRREPAVRRA